MKKLFYISLDRSVVKKQLGGYSHIKGVIDGVKNYYKLKVGAYCTNLLDVNDDSVTYIDIHHKAYYFQVFKILLSDKNTDIFLFRKNLIGMYVVSIAFLIKRLLGSKQKYFFEFNAISGDYQVDSKIKSIILLYLEEKKYDEISEIMGITQNNVRVKMSRIKDKLRKISKEKRKNKIIIYIYIYN